MMLAPHLAAVWMAYRQRPFWSGVLAGVAFWISPKGALVAAACVLWDPGGVAWIAAGIRGGLRRGGRLAGGDRGARRPIGKRSGDGDGYTPAVRSSNRRFETACCAP